MNIINISDTYSLKNAKCKLLLFYKLQLLTCFVRGPPLLSNFLTCFLYAAKKTVGDRNEQQVTSTAWSSRNFSRTYTIVRSIQEQPKKYLDTNTSQSRYSTKSLFYEAIPYSAKFVGDSFQNHRFNI